VPSTIDCPEFDALVVCDRSVASTSGRKSSRGLSGGLGSSAAPSGLTQPFAHTPSQDAHAFRYDGKGLTDLGTLGGSSSIGRGIGPGGHVVGDAYLAGNAGPHAFFHNGTAMADLGTLGGSVSGALTINAANTIVGEELYCNAGVSAGVPS
jgi:probable HAF family extracellular repeat protein